MHKPLGQNEANESPSFSLFWKRLITLGFGLAVVMGAVGINQYYSWRRAQPEPPRRWADGVEITPIVAKTMSERADQELITSIRGMQVSPEIKAQVYTAYTGAQNEDDFNDRFKALNIPSEDKAKLYALYTYQNMNPAAAPVAHAVVSLATRDIQGILHYRLSVAFPGSMESLGLVAPDLVGALDAGGDRTNLKSPLTLSFLDSAMIRVCQIAIRADDVIRTQLSPKPGWLGIEANGTRGLGDCRQAEIREAKSWTMEWH